MDSESDEQTLKNIFKKCTKTKKREKWTFLGIHILDKIPNSLNKKLTYV